MELEGLEEGLAAIIEGKLKLGIKSKGGKFLSILNRVENAISVRLKNDLHSAVVLKFPVDLVLVHVVVVDSTDFHCIRMSSFSSAQVDGALVLTGLAEFP